MRFLAFLMTVLPAVALAQTDRAPDDVMDALRIGEVAAILEREAVATSSDLVEGLVPQARHGGWARIVARINDADRVEARLRETFAETLEPDAVAPILAFFDTALGARIIGLELSAREVLTTPGVEEAAAERFQEAVANDAPQVPQVEAFIDANDLIDSNVIGALNANAAFLEGMQDSGASGLGAFVPEGDIRQEVWRQEPQIREGTISWVTAFVSLAYDPLPSDDFDAYIAFSQSDAGQALNQALFAAFDEVFVATARETGAALAGMLMSEDL